MQSAFCESTNKMRHMADKVRIDKWLWSVRIFRTRTIATNACKSGRIRIKDVVAKPSSSVAVGDTVTVQKDGFNFTFKVLKLIEKRVGYAIASTCYEDRTPEAERNKYKDWFIGKAAVERREKGAGRPTKKERRVIEEFKEQFFSWDDWMDWDE